MKNNKSKIIVFCLIAVFTIIIYTNISYATNELPERYNLAEHYNIKLKIKEQRETAGLSLLLKH